MLAARCPSAVQICRVKAATDVFPLVPVTAATMRGWRGKNLAAITASARRALSTRAKAASLRERNLRPALGHDRRRAGSERGRDEGQPVSLAAGNRDERIAAPDRAAVSRHPGDVEIGVAGLDLRVCGQDLAKLHGGSVDVRPRLTCFPLSRPV